jgi:hypothetical protein
MMTRSGNYADDDEEWECHRPRATVITGDDNAPPPLFPPHHGLDHFADERRDGFARGEGLFLARAAGHVHPEHAKARREVGDEQPRQAGEPVDARLVPEPQRPQERQRECRAFDRPLDAQGGPFGNSRLVSLGH